MIQQRIDDCVFLYQQAKRFCEKPMIMWVLKKFTVFEKQRLIDSIPSNNFRATFRDICFEKGIFTQLTVKELRDLAKAQHLTNYQSANKLQLILDLETFKARRMSSESNIT